MISLEDLEYLADVIEIIAAEITEARDQFGKTAFDENQLDALKRIKESND